jgi:hypothetical protein
LLLRYGVDIPDKVLATFVNNRPGLRDIAIRALCKKGYSRTRFNILKAYVVSGYCVDTASIFFVCRAIVDLPCPNGRKFRADLKDIIDHVLSQDTEVGFVSAIWLLSKFGREQDILACLTTKEHLWFENDWIGRQVGATYPRFASGRYYGEFLELVRRSRNAGAQATYSIHHTLVRDGTKHDEVFKYLRAPNPSQPRKFIFPKVLLLVSFLLSPAPLASKRALRRIYGGLPLDHYELSCFRGLL